MEDRTEEKKSVRVADDMTKLVGKTHEEVLSFFVKKQIVNGCVGSVLVTVLSILLFFFITWCLVKTPPELGPVYSFQLKLTAVCFGTGVFFVLVGFLDYFIVSCFSPEARAIKELLRVAQKRTWKNFALREREQKE